MEFFDNKHKQFYEQKLKEIGKSDVYRKALVYTLGICETTREHFNNIFNLKSGEININAVTAPYQTSTSKKVTRMAFSLWNRCNYDSEQDIENDKVSTYYNPSEIFCCTYAPYFWQAIKIRYPEVVENTKSNYSDATADFVFDLKRLLNRYCRTSIKEMSLIEDGKYIKIDGNRIDIEANSNLATINDVTKFLLK